MAFKDISIVENVNECMLKYTEHSERFFTMLPALGEKKIVGMVYKKRGFYWMIICVPKIWNMKLRVYPIRSACTNTTEVLWAGINNFLPCCLL